MHSIFTYQADEFSEIKIMPTIRIPSVLLLKPSKYIFSQWPKKPHVPSKTQMHPGIIFLVKIVGVYFNSYG